MRLIETDCLVVLDAVLVIERSERSVDQRGGVGIFGVRIGRTHQLANVRMGAGALVLAVLVPMTATAVTAKEVFVFAPGPRPRALDLVVLGGVFGRVEQRLVDKRLEYVVKNGQRGRRSGRRRE